MGETWYLVSGNCFPLMAFWWLFDERCPSFPHSPSQLAINSQCTLSSIVCEIWYKLLNRQHRLCPFNCFTYLYIFLYFFVCKNSCKEGSWIHKNPIRKIAIQYSTARIGLMKRCEISTRRGRWTIEVHNTFMCGISIWSSKVAASNVNSNPHRRRIQLLRSARNK